MTMPKHQHWVPQFYLKQFSTPESFNSTTLKVWVWNKEKNDFLPGPISVRKICGQRYLYTPEDNQGERNWEMEDYLSDQESEAAKVWPKLLSGELDFNNVLIRQSLARFITTLHLRNVKVFDAIDNVMELRDKLYGPPSSDFLAGLDSSASDPTHSGRFFVDTIIKNTERIVQQLIKKNWLVMCSEDRIFFTSDKPVIYNPKTAKPKGGVLILPLSSDRVLYMTNDEIEIDDLYRKAPECLAREVNAMTESNSIRFVISSYNKSSDS